MTLVDALLQLKKKWEEVFEVEHEKGGDEK